jgi:hypothetical protein
MLKIPPIRILRHKNGKKSHLLSIFDIIRVGKMESKPKFKLDRGLKPMDQVRQVMRYHHYAYRTEQTYCDWILRFIRFHGSKRHPKDMGKSEVEGFLSHLASDGKVSASTQSLARKYRGAAKEFRWQCVSLQVPW